MIKNRLCLTINAIYLSTESFLDARRYMLELRAVESVMP
ncbi:hypothetical protein ALP68_102816 [Pseudomonas ficuserectae]|uniref:Uncharacterized protein n=3 Tax=Pseudomonas syringae group genomosp. 2 TaxID=251698 RepID=A0A0P9UIQ5_PSEA0|nr:Unknown protein sequence [Pseudomonas amygdali pv. lachrymans]KPW58410.1 hypothetical protein ALO82_102911 [Pseudomonas syringae pv. broussonetiae]KPX43402.1 hypothetical protein ALO69_103194 [Pseudomonas ficuserectae]KPX85014.1 hypothetical protein ALO63_103158 [Pseudomonas amygdali pv. mori]RMS30973.1 hypothetical protein ALP70_103147 [Pseudomonas savastanoi]